MPAGVPGVPAMLSKGERRLLYALARDYASDDAAIVDTGCFLGGSTAALLRGLDDRDEPWNGPPVAAYDLFRVEPYLIPKFFSDDPSVRVGDSFRDRFDANVAGFAAPHVVHEGDIAELGWSGEAIAILFLDVLKSWELNDAVLRDFCPSLVPGRSVVIHQDYGMGYMPWIPITVELMRDSLVLIDWMEWGSHVYLVEDELPQTVMANGVKRLDLDSKFELIDRAVGRSDGWVRGMVEISRSALVAERDGDAAARADLDLIAARYRGYDRVVQLVSDIKATLGGRPTPRARLRSRLGGARRRLTGVRPSPNV
jgi:hypothetical protein